MEKVVLVTGASSGIGKEIVRKLANYYEVIIHYNNSKKEALELKQELDHLYNKDLLIVNCDLSKESETWAYSSWVHKEIKCENNVPVFENTK